MLWTQQAQHRLCGWSVAVTAGLAAGSFLTVYSVQTEASIYTLLACVVVLLVVSRLFVISRLLSVSSTESSRQWAVSACCAWAGTWVLTHLGGEQDAAQTRFPLAVIAVLGHIYLDCAQVLCCAATHSAGGQALGETVVEDGRVFGDKVARGGHQGAGAACAAAAAQEGAAVTAA